MATMIPDIDPGLIENGLIEKRGQAARLAP
jgi:hypothetical protein